MFFHEPLGVMDFGPVSDDGSLQADQRWLNADIMTQPVGFCNPAESRTGWPINLQSGRTIADY